MLHLGGALNERDEDDGAVGNRDARYAIGAKAMWPPDAANGDRSGWVRAAHERLRPFSTGRTYVNFQAVTTRTRRAFGRRTARTTTGSSS